MTDSERDKLYQEMKELVKQKEWQRNMAKKLLPLIEADLKGEIDLNKPISTRIPFLSVKRDGQGKVYLCVKFNDIHCPTCIFSNQCLIKKGTKDENFK